jgi:hypothetical protein
VQPDDGFRWPQISRLPLFMGIAAVATVAALLAWYALAVLEVGGDDFLGASIVHADLIFPVAMACGLVVGIAAVSTDRRRVGLRRAATVSLLLLASGVGLIVVWSSAPETAFSATKFRAAAAAGNDEELERQAHRAVEQDALIGLTAAEVRAALGKPSRIRRRRHQWSWELGMINDFIGPGDAGALYVRFDPSLSRVIAAKVDVSAF